MGLLPSTLKIESGRIRLQGADLLGASPAELRSLRGRIVSIVFQDPLSALNPLMTIGDQILEVMDAHPAQAPQDRAARVAELLSEVGLPDPETIRHQYPFRLSGDQRQRVGIARARKFDPLPIVADEAVSALDVSIQVQILDLLEKIQRETGVAMVFITHDLRVASRLCDQVGVMHRGRMVEFGPPSRIFHAPGHAYTQSLVAAIPGSDWDRTA